MWKAALLGSVRRLLCTDFRARLVYVEFYLWIILQICRWFLLVLSWVAKRLQGEWRATLRNKFHNRSASIVAKRCCRENRASGSVEMRWKTLPARNFGQPQPSRAQIFELPFINAELGIVGSKVSQSARVELVSTLCASVKMQGVICISQKRQVITDNRKRIAIGTRPRSWWLSQCVFCHCGCRLQILYLGYLRASNGDVCWAYPSPQLRQRSQRHSDAVPPNLK